MMAMSSLVIDAAASNFGLVDLAMIGLRILRKRAAAARGPEIRSGRQSTAGQRELPGTPSPCSGSAMIQSQLSLSKGTETTGLRSSVRMKSALPATDEFSTAVKATFYIT